MATAGLGDPEPAVRATALGAMARIGSLDAGHLSAARSDPSAIVRRRAAELAPAFGSASVGPLVAALGDDDPRVVEAACFALGEIGAQAAEAVASIGVVVTDADDPLCREAGVAALGAIGDPAGLVIILSATTDKPAVRRRAVLALAPFEGPEVDEALERALTDRDWQVRQAAEDLLGPAPT
jgi:HEAT repeat protein